MQQPEGASLPQWADNPLVKALVSACRCKQMVASSEFTLAELAEHEGIAPSSMPDNARPAPDAPSVETFMSLGSESAENGYEDENDELSDLDTGKRAAPIQSKIVTFDNDHERVRWLRADHNTGSGLIPRRLQAERDGYRVRTFTTLDDLPDHARTKFEMIESVVNAEILKIWFRVWKPMTANRMTACSARGRSFSTFTRLL